jgi:hypothetical protein
LERPAASEGSRHPKKIRALKKAADVISEESSGVAGVASLDRTMDTFIEMLKKFPDAYY